jgi:hypothetical protein
LRDLLAALDGMPEKALVAQELETLDGAVCALGALGKVRQLNMQDVDPEDYDAVASLFGVAHQLAQEIVYLNDEGGFHNETPEFRWQRMRTWVASNIRDPKTDTDGASSSRDVTAASERGEG